MREKFLSSYKHIFLLVPLLVVMPHIVAAPCGTTVNWSGTAIPTTDQNINVGSGINIVPGPINVQALTCDIAITVNSGNAVLESSASNQGRLYFYAAAGRTITVQVSDNLSFEGALNGSTPLDLLVTFSGPGTLAFLMNGGTAVSFTQSSSVSGGTEFFVGLGQSGSAPVVQFEHSGTNPSLPFNVVVGPESVMSYISDNSLSFPTGTIEFSPGASSSSNVGGILSIGNTGAVLIGSYLVTAGLNTNFTLNNISLTTQANGQPQFIIDSDAVTAGNSASLQIVNANNACTDLFSDPFCQHGISGNLNSPQTGFILVAPSILEINDETYLEYVGTATNTCCTFTLLDSCSIPQSMQRLRNGSAFIVDGLNSSISHPAQILLNGTSAIYFLSGVDNCGNVSADFTISNSLLTPCAGNIVFDVEAYLNLIGTSSNTNAINILSLQVQPTGCPVTEGSGLNNFPKRTFAVDAQGNYLRYNSGAFLINNRMNLFRVSLTHNDENHAVFEEFNLGNPNLGSEPTYVGGDSYLFPCHAGQQRPTVAFYNSAFRIQTSVASTGMDWLVPNLMNDNNNSAFVFYNNGRCVDDGYGRNMILGTDICFDTCITTSDMASHLNVFQEIADANPGELNLYILTATNSNCTTQGITGDISNQFAIQTIYLNNETNISIGTNGSMGVDVNTGQSFALTVTGALLVDSVYISFESRGGELAYPPSSATTGQGGIFVDALGQFQVLNNRIANIGAMVATSRGGLINLPYNSVFFDPEIGIQQWNLDLNDPTQRVIIAAGQEFSDFTLDWGAVQKAYCCDSTIITSTCYIPYEVEEVPAPCAAAPIIPQNLNALPTIQGTVDQLQILRARIGDPANILIDGGFVRELVFIQGYNSAQAPTGIVVIQNDGIVGLGTTHKDTDALQGSVVLGVNGVTLVPNGNGTMILNEDIIINNVCHILTGTNFGVNGQNTLVISSDLPRELRIKDGGVLDLSQFTTADQVLAISGQVHLVCEPGSRIILGGGTLVFNEQAQMYIRPSIVTAGTTVASNDDARVIMSGSGAVQFVEGASMLIPSGGYFGIESYTTCSNITNISFELSDESSIQIGNPELPGGVFQVGDTTYDPTRSVSFQLLLSGPGATFNIDRQGFFGLGVGMVDNTSSIPNDWLVGCLSNITTVSLVIEEGTFVHNKIFNGSDTNASLLALGNQGSYAFLFNPLTSVILGGGNMVQIDCTVLPSLSSARETREFKKLQEKLMHVLILSDAELAQLHNLNPFISHEINNYGDIVNLVSNASQTQQDLVQQALASVIPTSINPTVSSFAGFTSPYLNSGIMAGEYLLTDPSKGAQPTNVSAATLFNYLKTDNYAGPSLTGVAPSNKRANFAPGMLNIGIAGFVSDGSLINRIEFQQGFLLGRENNPTEFEHSFAIGAVNIIIDPDTDSLVLPTEIIGAAAY